MNLLDYLTQTNAEEQLLETLLEQVNKNEMDMARMTAAKIQATRDIRFNLKKIYVDNLRDTDKKTSPKTTDKKVST